MVELYSEVTIGYNPRVTPVFRTPCSFMWRIPVGTLVVHVFAWTTEQHASHIFYTNVAHEASTILILLPAQNNMTVQ